MRILAKYKQLSKIYESLKTKQDNLNYFLPMQKRLIENLR